MRTYHGTTLSGFLDSQRAGICVTDEERKAIRYANSQATGRVVSEFGPMVEGAVVLTIEAPNPEWVRRSNGKSLDACEAWLAEGSFVITSARIAWRSGNTSYGRAHLNRTQAANYLRNRGIAVNE